MTEHSRTQTLEAEAGEPVGTSAMFLTRFRFSSAMLGFLCAPEGGMPAAPGNADAVTGAGLKAGIQSESARLEDVKDLLGEPWWRLATSNSNCTALAISQCHEWVKDLAEPWWRLTTSSANCKHWVYLNVMHGS